jgi:hypothetical protein
MIDESELPDELQSGGAELARPKDAESEARRQSRLAALGTLVGDKRDAAVRARKESGIEDLWAACEEAYAGIDETNRSDAAGSQPWKKPTSITGPLTRNLDRQAEVRSTVFIRLTTRYVDMAASKAKEKALPVGGMPFSLEPSPMPDMVATLEAEQPQAQPVPNPASAQPAQLSPAAQAAKQAIDQARDSAKKAGQRIWDWLEESKYSKHIRRVIDDSARIGVGVLKGPFPEGKTDRAMSQDGNAAVLEIVQKTYPGVTWVDPWNFFPAGNCGEDIHDGDHVFERSFLSEAKLRGLKDLVEPMGEAIYIAENIDKVIDEGPDKCNYDESGQRKQIEPDKKGLYQVWQYTGEMTRADMIELGALGAEELPDEVVYCNAIVTLVNDTVIRAQFNPLEKSGNFPYRTFPWSRRAGFWAGVGVAEQVSVPQRMVNAGTRAWMNNAGVSAGVQLVIDTSKLRPADNSLVVGGGIKIWETTAEGMGVDVRTLMAAIQIPNLGEELKNIVDYAFYLAEELSNIPLVAQGRDGPTTPQTFGQAELQNSNGNTLLRNVADTLDNDVIEPLIGDYYEWLLLDPEVPEDEKGDFQIIAKGCTAMVEKAIQEQTLMMMLNLALNPAWGQDPKKFFAKVMETKRLDPEETAYSAEDLQRIQSTPPPDAPAVAAAKINAATKIHVQDMQDQSELQRIQWEAQNEAQMIQTGGTTPHQAMALARVEQARIHAASSENIENSRAAAEAARADKELQIARENGWFDLQKMQLQKEIALLTYVNTQKITLMQAKSELAQTAMVEQTKRELAGLTHAVTLNEGAADRAHDLQKHHSTLAAGAKESALDREHEMATAAVPPQPDVSAPPDNTAQVDE